MRGGSGLVDQKRVVDILNTHGVNERSRRRWLNQAVQLGILTPYQSKKGVKGYKITSAEKAALKIGCTYVGSRPVAISVSKMLRSGWRSYVWAAYLACFSPNPLSRQKKAQLSGVARRTQIALEKPLPLGRTPTYVITDTPAAQLGIYKDLARGHAFAFRDPYGRGVIAYRNPDIVTVPLEIARTLVKGRTRKINKFLTQAQSVELSIKGQLQPQKALLETGLLFFEKVVAAENKSRVYQIQPDLFQKPIQEVFVATQPSFRHPHDKPSVKFWVAMAVKKAVEI